MIGFWLNKDNAFRSSTSGLTKEQLDFLKSLNVGDRLVIFPARKEQEARFPDLTLLKVENNSDETIEVKLPNFT